MRLFIFILLLTGCAAGQPKPYAELFLEWQIDPWSDWMLQPEREWMGDSPYLTGRFGVEWGHGIKCPELSSSTSLFTGAPFKEKSPANPQQELHWARIGCGMKWGGY